MAERGLPLPARFRKRPVVIEALRHDGTLRSALAVRAFVGDFERAWCDRKPREREDRWYVFIRTLEGVMEAAPEDWIIRGVAGEFYPCKPDIFEQTYEVVPTCDTEGS